MKIKHGLIATLILAPLCVIFRIAQYFSAIDSAGYFLNTKYAAMLKIGLYVLLAVSAVLAAALIFLTEGDQAEFDDAVNCKGSGIVFLLIAGVLLFTGGNAVGYFVSSGALDIAGIIAIPSALFFVFAGFKMLFGRKPGALCSFFGIFPPIYMFVCAITEFFGSFKHANDSRGKIDMLVMCVCALFVMALVAVNAGAKVRKARFAAVASLCCVFCATRGIADIAAMIAGKMTPDISVLSDVLFETLLIPLSIIILVRLGAKKSEPDIEEQQNTVEKDMDIYIDDLPDQE